MSFLIPRTIDEAPLRLALMTRLDGKETLWWLVGALHNPLFSSSLSLYLFMTLF
ncbi:hypothetical protein DFH06DRAFT_1484986 [Mycena polygramma]|nr:hypothetical protein DFH06DRAFT_1484986 [Mycena polygramma]